MFVFGKILKVRRNDGHCSLLASGSDDMQIRLWNVEGKPLHCIKSGHMNNIFSVQFLPSGSDDLLISAAGN